MIDTSSPLLLNVDDMSLELRLTRKAVYDRVWKGDLSQPVRLARSLRWRRSDIDRFVEALGGVASLSVGGAE